MSLPLPADYAPMEANTAAEIPKGGDWQYEPKWDGFRALIFRDGDSLLIQSKSGQPLARYFPELVAALTDLPPAKFVLDGEIVILAGAGLDFDALLQRIHPAESRIRKLARETPANLLLFDMLVDENGSELASRGLEDRRTALESFAAEYLSGSERIQLSPKTNDFETARQWFQRMAGPLDGVVAKRLGVPYASGERNAMLKIKNLRTADCVVGGFRYGSKGGLVGSLLLGLYNEEGKLDHVGFCSGLAAAEKPALTDKLAKLVTPPGFTGNAPGGPSRWSTERSTQWEPLAPELVVEVQYDHFSGGRFRHGTRLLRWRPDKRASSCTTSQVERQSDSALTLLERKS